MSKPKLYIAGPYNGGDEITVFQNIAHGLALNARVKALGFRTYCPWADFLEALFMPYRSASEWKKDSIEELLECDGLVLADQNPRWQDSQGTIDELATCAWHGIPIFFESGSIAWQHSHYVASDQEDDGETD